MSRYCLSAVLAGNIEVDIQVGQLSQLKVSE